jgi:hypothetical protein
VAVPPRVRALSFHASYRCANAGACCVSGWDIPVEPPAEEGIRRAVAEGRLLPADALRPAAGLPHGARVVLARDAASGRCVFHDPGPPGCCAVHARLGEEALATACRQFPRVATLTPLGVSVTLSHYCPTAAALLFGDAPARIVASPPAFPASWLFEGLDARDALPPFLRPGVLASWAALERWEEHAVAALAAGRGDVAEVLAFLAAGAETVRAWRPGDGAFDAFFESALRAPTPAALEAASAWPALEPLAAWDLVAATVPAGHPRPARPPAARVDLAPSAGAPVRRWLAAHAFASWLALQGPGLRTTALGLAVALAVLRAELARGGGEGGDLLVEAIRRADLLLAHLADPQALADRLGACEGAPARAVLASIVPA